MNSNSENSGDDLDPRDPMQSVAADRLQRLGLLSPPPQARATNRHATSGHTARTSAASTVSAVTPPRSAWPMLVVALISINMVIVGITIYLANGHGAGAVEPAYYQKATQWDQTVKRQAASDRLGWSMSLAIHTSAQSSSHTAAAHSHVATPACELRLVLHDAQATPVEHAAVEVEAFHNAFSRERLYLKLNESAKGIYSVPAPIARAGSWHFRIRADRGSQIFVHEFDQEIALISNTPQPPTPNPTPPN
jgi:nitrogen fixation protein FixH